jgi:hypothetical protein
MGRSPGRQERWRHAGQAPRPQGRPPGTWVGEGAVEAAVAAPPLRLGFDPARTKQQTLVGKVLAEKGSRCTALDARGRAAQVRV